MFSSLTFQNFRGFENLQLEGLKRVNLVVGRNNAGKTSLLEGIAILTDPTRMREMPIALRTPLRTMPQGEMSPANQRYFRWLIRDATGTDRTTLMGAWDRVERSATFKRREASPVTSAAPHAVIDVQFNGQVSPFVLHAPSGQSAISFRIVPVQFGSPEELVERFAAAVRHRGGEERIEGLLRKVDERVRKVRVEPAKDGNHVLVDIGLSEMLPVSQVGQGIQRLISIFSEIVGGNPDVCIIDEVENGIHHSMLEQVWNGVGLAAADLNVQIFATTHSRECIEAAHAAFTKRDDYDFSIIQLFRVEGGVQGRVLDRKHIEAAMSGEIDLR
jgi:AAA domain, putative AbiEii toxin, Type IV TA system/AAA ATPase domain